MRYPRDSIWARSARANIGRIPGRTSRIVRGISNGSYGWSSALSDMTGPYRAFTNAPRLRAIEGSPASVSNKRRRLPPPPNGPKQGHRSTRSEPTQTSGSQRTWASKKFRIGRPISRNALALKSVKANKHITVYRWSRMNVNNDEVGSSGALWMYNKVLTPDTARSLPFYAWDLTSVNNVAVTPTILTAIPCTRMQMSTSGAIDFVDVQADNANGVGTTPNWVIERAPANESVIYPRESDFLKWFNIKLNLMGTKNSTTKYTIMLCQFKIRELCPDNSTNLEGGQDTVVQNEKRNNYYQALMKPLTVNPIATTNSTYGKYVKVLKKQTVVLQDQSAESLDTDPLSKVVSWFVRVNKVCNYRTLNQNLTTAANVLDEVDYPLQLGTGHGTRLHHKSRIYLLVYCNNYGADSAANPDNTHTPSFDCNIRVAHEGYD